MSRFLVIFFIYLMFIICCVSQTFGQTPSRVELRSFSSPSLGTNKYYKIYLPSGYDEGSERYPVVYFLRNHENEWFAGNYTGREGNALKEVADQLIAAGMIGKMILVAPNTGSNSGDYVGLGVNMLRPDLASSAGIGTGLFEDFIISDLVEEVDATYRTIPDRNHRGIDGFSYGGYSSTMLGMRHPELFGSVGSYDGAIMWHDLDDPTIPGPGPDDPLWMPSDPGQNAVFGYPRNVAYMLLHAASNILTSAYPAQIDSLRGIRYHISCSYDQMIGNTDPNLELLGLMRDKGIRNSMGGGVLSPTAAHDYGYADLHATGSLIKHWQTFNGTAISAPGIIDFSITETGIGDTSDVVIFNYGPGSIIVSSINNSVPEFEIIGIPPLPMTIGEDDTITFKVLFDPTENIVYTDTIRILSTDSSTPFVKVILRGKGGSFRARAGTIYAATTGGISGLYSVDETSGNASFIGPYRRGWTSVSSIRIRPGTKELIGIAPKAGDWYRLMRVNALGGDAFISLGFIHAADVKSMAFYDDSTLFIGSSTGTLFTVNINDRSLYLEPTLIGDIGFPLAGIAVKPQTNELWATVNSTINPDRVYRIKVFPTLEITMVGKTGLNRVTTDLAIDECGNLYGLSGMTLIRIDTTNGQGTIIGSLGIANANSITISPLKVLFSPRTVDFGTLVEGEADSLIRTITVFNLNSNIIHILSAVIEDQLPYEVAPSSMEILPFDSTVVNVIFKPTIYGSYNGHITFTHDAEGSQTVIEVLGTYAPRSVQFAVDAGWNMVSLPMQPFYYEKNSMFHTSISPAYSYINGYNQKDTLSNGVGYWLKYSTPEMVEVPGTVIFSDTFDVQIGWNMIGSITYPVSVSNITSDPGSMVLNGFYKYLGSNSYGITDTIKPGFGYWVKADRAGKLILSSSANVPMSGRIKIVAGSELPPAPPDDEKEIVMNKEIPTEYSLAQNFPNPFNPNTTFSYGLPERSKVLLEVYNTLGQIVATLVNDEQEAGYNSVSLISQNGIGSGVYFYRLIASSVEQPGKTFVQVRKMIVMK